MKFTIENKYNFIATDKNGMVFAFVDRPEYIEYTWERSDSPVFFLVHLHKTQGAWRDSLVEV